MAGVWRLAAVLAPLLLAGCGSSDPTIQTRNVVIEIAPKANDDAPVAVDLVLAYDKQLLAQVAGLSAAEWFKRRKDIVLSFPTEAEIHSFEVMPGQRTLNFELPDRAEDAIGAFVFVKYDRPGMFRARLDSLPSPLIKLGQEDFVIETRS